MRTVRTKVYKFNELSEKAKQTAIQWYRGLNWNSGYAWSSEINESFEKIQENVVTPLQNIQEEISGTRLYTWIQNNLSCLWTKNIYFSKHKNGDKKRSTFAYKYDECTKYRRSRIEVKNEIDNCPFTGVCFDIDFLIPITDFMKNPTKNVSNTDLAEKITDLLEKIHETSEEEQDGEEFITETIEANEYEFTIDGNRF